MSKEKIERILNTYRPVEGKPGYVWFSNYTIIELQTLREAYEEFFEEKDGREISDT